MKTILPIAVTTVLVVAGCSRSEKPAQTDAIDAVVRAFEDHDLVALGDAHGLQQQTEFVLRLLRDDRFADAADAIVTEFGNARYQTLVDRYVAGDPIPIERLRPTWRDLLGAEPGMLDAPAALFETVREVNAGRSPEERIRVLLGDPPFDWSKLRHREQFGRALQRRDSFYATVVNRAVLGKRKKALLLAGSLHFARLPERIYGGPNAIDLIERAHPGRAFVVLPYFGAGPQRRAFEERFEPADAPSITPVDDDSLEGVPATRVLPNLLLFENAGAGEGKEGGTFTRRGDQAPPDPFASLSIREIADALLYLGPCSTLTKEAPSRAPYREPAYRSDLDRRSTILSGRRFVPPPDDGGEPYCEAVGAATVVTP